MPEGPNNTDRMQSYLVVAATAGTIVFNWLSATGWLGGIETGEISDKYPTTITPAGYAFSIWSLIYLGLVAFSIYQLLPPNLVRFRNIRSPYIMSCALNCAWLYFWHGEYISICFGLIAGLCFVLFSIVYQLRDPETRGGRWLAKAPFGLYFGWVTVATLVNFAVMLVYLQVSWSGAAWTALGVTLILVAATLAVLVRIKLADFLYPVAVAWALTAIAIKQSGQTFIVAAAAAGVIACLIAALSFVMKLPSRAAEN